MSSQELFDFDNRVKAVQNFKSLPEAENLASAYKRINNILSKADNNINYTVIPSLLCEDAEKHLFDALSNVSNKVNDLYAKRDYKNALSTLSELREPVDKFFENVMVNVDNQDIKNNRLGILKELHSVISKTADISVLY